MNSLENTVFLSGRIGADPEIRYNDNHSCVANFNLAVTENFKKDGEWTEKTTWIPCNAWGKQAENIEKYVRKGTRFLAHGRLQVDNWTDKEGNKHTKMYVQIDEFVTIPDVK